jgi:outer membrane protein TolC
MDRSRWMVLVLWMAGMPITGGAWGQAALTLEDYLGQVRSQGTSFQSSQAAAEGYEKQSHQQDLTYSPQLSAGYSHQSDQEQQATLLAATQTLTDSAGVSLTDKLPFGPSLTLGYAFTDTNITYPSELLKAFGVFAPDFLESYYQVSPVVSLSIPMFKDFGGTQTAAGVHQSQYQFESEEKNSAFQTAQVIYNAKVAYWNLALARQQVTIHQDTLDRSQKIWDWTKRRVARNLADPPDALQAEASVRLAELDLEQSTEAERSARLQFNHFRGTQTGDVPETLQSLEESLSKIKVDLPANPPDRLDLRSVQKTADSQKAAYDNAYQNIYPDITLNASWRGNGLDPNFPYANTVAWGPDHPTWNVGAQFNLSLDLFTAQRVAEGFKRSYESALLAYQDKRAQVDQDWQDWRNQMADVEKRLAMTAEIEEIQKNKADQERVRLEYGRTTEFQLLSFENDYNSARLNHLSVIQEKLSLLAKAQWWLSTEKQ